MTISLPMCAIDFGSSSMDEEEQALADAIQSIKSELGQDLLILGHHYQRDQIVMHADLLGDSFLLSKLASESDAKFVIFCGVHFMAESADILTGDHQSVILPNLRAGCSMADMAVLEDVQSAWDSILQLTDLRDPMNREDANKIVDYDQSYLVPITYMNSSAELKSFVGKHGGIVCTSSNAEGVINWALERAGPNGKLLFFPDQHLGRNTGLKLGLKEFEMFVWNPEDGLIDADKQSLEQSKLILWHGFCSVHQRFSVEQIASFRKREPNGLVVVHPECSKEVVEAADAVGSTEFIRNFVKQSQDDAKIAIGTEINMVARLNNEYPNKEIECLDANVCPCSTMYMIHPAYLLDVLEKIRDGSVPNQIIVPEQTAKYALIALERMLSITS
jgi:quinolinate synthase